ncbi:MAG: triphosphoribosyl-dephospho-CoA synthase CitG [Lachnospiraceae bacterium]|nr:triphosphoribosyl-dephospho-CoA synthase CitG [Lachnospiraceae bacterium]
MLKDMEVSIEDMMEFRDMKNSILTDYLDRYPGSIVLSLGMNIPGPKKNNDQILNGFFKGEDTLTELFEKKEYDIEDKVTLNSKAGNVGLFVLRNVNAEELKKEAVGIEENSSLGRLYDIDVYRTDGTQVSRREIGFPGRKCLLCGQDAKICGRSRAHSLEELENKVNSILDAEIIADTARWALIEEVMTTPKPGLVDCCSNGAHKDMDLMTFVNSANALKPYFKKMALCGFNNYKEPKKIFQKIRSIGIEAEEAMYKATGGVNTHKGLIFSIGILSAASAAARKKYGRYSREDIFSIEQDMVKDILLKELAEKKYCRPVTHGENVYRKYGASGVRGEAVTGYQTVREVALKELDEGIAAGHDFEDVKIQTFIALLANVEDSNILSRSDIDTLKKVQWMAGELYRENGVYGNDSKAVLKSWDKLFIEWNISPGGCADLLAIALFIHRLTGGQI